MKFYLLLHKKHDTQKAKNERAAKKEKKIFIQMTTDFFFRWQQNGVHTQLKKKNILEKLSFQILISSKKLINNCSVVCG